MFTHQENETVKFLGFAVGSDPGPAEENCPLELNLYACSMTTVLARAGGTPTVNNNKRATAVERIPVRGLLLADKWRPTSCLPTTVRLVGCN